MRTVYLHLSIGYPTANHYDEMEVEDDATDEEIDQMTREWADNYIEFGWSNEPSKKHR